MQFDVGWASKWGGTASGQLDSKWGGARWVLYSSPSPALHHQALVLVRRAHYSWAGHHCMCLGAGMGEGDDI